MRLQSRKEPQPAQAKDRAYYRLRDRWRRAFIISHRLSAADKLIGLALLEDVNRKGWHAWGWLEAWPAQTTLARRVHRARRNVQTNLWRLVRFGVVVVTQKGDPRTHANTHYRFEADWLHATEAEATDVVRTWPDKRLNQASVENDARASDGIDARASVDSIVELASKATHNLTETDQLDNSPDLPSRAGARGGKGFVGRRVGEKRKGRAAEALEDALSDLARLEVSND